MSIELLVLKEKETIQNDNLTEIFIIINLKKKIAMFCLAIDFTDCFAISY